jgi:lysozyme
MTYALGVDWSFWDMETHPETAKANGCSFCFIKASQRIQDKRFTENWQKSKGVLLRSAYHYLDFGVSELAQADTFVKAMNGDWGELPPVLDIEQNPAEYNVSNKLAQGKVWNWLTRVKAATGKTPMIYSGYYYWTEHMTPNDGWKQFYFWLAWYANESIIRVPKPWITWNFWQFTDRGDAKKYGSSKAACDLNFYHGTESDLYAEFGGGQQYKTCPTCLGTGKVLA